MLFKNEDTPAAELIVDGVWLDLKRSEIENASDKMMEIMVQYPRTEYFHWIENGLSN